MAIHGQSAVVHVLNTTDGWKQLAATIHAAGIEHVGIEATGGYERGVMGHLRRQGITVTLLQPVQVKAFGMLHLRRAKTDRIDSGSSQHALTCWVSRTRLHPMHASNRSVII